MLKVTFLSPDKTGFAENFDVHPNTMLWTFLQARGITDPTLYSIRVNNIPVTADEVLNQGDRIVVGYVNLKAA